MLDEIIECLEGFSREDWLDLAELKRYGVHFYAYFDYETLWIHVPYDGYSE